MLALQAYESQVCPLCGMHTSTCHDEESVTSLYRTGRVEVCFATQMRNRAIQEFESSGTVPDDMRGAVTTTLTPRPPAT
ncbi:hypothetical protein [Bifidobacterium samirii]|uniref:Uncharacterized protein n=1 Tax=Bifidobacterium samirii TaxID=2306974 RepID=A0A430FUM2_9BIFI|nr:hypothetical protein [Bifidobacterium samirii]RSX56775.1 hypothetical protein D2E24_1065 [Bifidobacterium samirii]